MNIETAQATLDELKGFAKRNKISLRTALDVFKYAQSKDWYEQGNQLFSQFMQSVNTPPMPAEEGDTPVPADGAGLSL